MSTENKQVATTTVSRDITVKVLEKITVRESLVAWVILKGSE